MKRKKKGFKKKNSVPTRLSLDLRRDLKITSALSDKNIEELNIFDIVENQEELIKLKEKRKKNEEDENGFFRF